MSKYTWLSTAAVYAIVPLGVLCTSPSWGADNCTGFDAQALQSSEMADLGKGLTLTSFKSQSVDLNNDSANNVIAGVCSGTTLQTQTGAQSTGFCARRDKDGDTQSISWSQAPGADKGEWTATSGTGKYADKKASGWFQDILVDGKIRVIKWGGNCQ